MAPSSESDGSAPSSIHALLLELQPALESYERRLIDSRGLRSSASGDAVRAVFARVLAEPAQLPHHDGESGVRRYIVKMITNEVCDTLRREGRDRVQAVDPAELHEYAELLATTGPVTRADQVRALEQLIHALPDKYRDIMELAFHEGLEFEELGGLLGVERRVVRRRYERAGELLQRKLGGAWTLTVCDWAGGDSGRLGDWPLCWC